METDRKAERSSDRGTDHRNRIPRQHLGFQEDFLGEGGVNAGLKCDWLFRMSQIKGWRAKWASGGGSQGAERL